MGNLKMTENENFKQLFDGARCVIVSTNRGTGIEGKTSDIQSCLAQLIHNLRFESGFSKEKIMECVELGLKTDQELKERLETNLKDAEKLEKIKEIIKEIFED